MIAVMLSAPYAYLYAGIEATKPTSNERLQKVHKMQIPFIANEGQADEEVAYYAKTFGGTACVTKEGKIVYLLPKNMADEKERNTIHRRAKGLDPKSPHYNTGVIAPLSSQPQWPSWQCDKWWQKIAQNTPDNIPGMQPGKHKEELSGVVLKEEFIGGKTSDVCGEKASETRVSYFRGNDPSK